MTILQEETANRATNPDQLIVQDLHAYYDRSHVLQGVSLNVQAGEVVALLGRNGAGKTTTLRSIVGLMSKVEGTLRLGNHHLQHKNTHSIAQMGIAYVPSGRRSFGLMTVKENLLIALDGNRNKNKPSDELDKVFEMFPALKRRIKTNAGVLSGGENQMLKMACSVLLGPSILLLDEPTEGLAPIVISELLEHVRTLANTGVGILLAEQNAHFAFELCQRAYVVNKGVVEMSGTVSELEADKELVTHLGI